jgi:hypothetical protein
VPRRQYRPNSKQIHRVVAYLEGIGLRIQGPRMDMRCGFELTGEQQYTAEETIQRYQLIRDEKLSVMEPPHGNSR